MPEETLEDTESGLAPASDGWFVVNVRDAEWWWRSTTFGAGCRFRDREHFFPQFGINVSVLGRPGQSNCLYHSESQQGLPRAVR